MVVLSHLHKAEQLEKTLTSENLVHLEKLFSEICHGKTEIGLEDFKKIIQSKNEFFTEQVFAQLDKDKKKTVVLAKYMERMREMLTQSPESKVKFLFDLYDNDGSARIDLNELSKVMHACLEQNGLKFSPEQVNELTTSLFEDADSEHKGSISFEQLEVQILRHPGLLENLSISMERWLVPPKPKKKPKKSVKPHWMSAKYISNNKVFIYSLVVYFIINLLLIAQRFIQYSDKGFFVMCARACGQCLNLTCMAVALTMLRVTITHLRDRGFTSILPLDEHVFFHKLTGTLVFFYSVGHALSHIINFTLKSMVPQNVANDDHGSDHIAGSVDGRLPCRPHLPSQCSVFEFLFTTKPGIGWVGGTAPITGWILLAIVIVIFTCSMPFVRKTGNFHVFYWTHNMYWLFWLLVTIHGPNFWFWFLIPGSMYMSGRLYRFIKLQYGPGHTSVLEAVLLPAKVTHLKIKRPRGFEFSPGDYIFIRIPVLSNHEWHPFTISSAPEQMEDVSLHIKSAGHWTGKLYEYFETMSKQNPPQASEKRSIGVRVPVPEDKPFDLYIDGPFGAPSSFIFHSDHAVLVGAGIGVTPFASILQSVAHRYRHARHVCPNCSYDWVDDVPPSIMRLKKVDFFWINREQKAFEWFVSIMSELEVEQAKLKENRILDLHMYITSAPHPADMKAVGLQLALDFLHDKDTRDLITGLKTRTMTGRPNWNEIFGNIKRQEKGDVVVFFCGPPPLGRELQDACDRVQFGFRQEVF